MASKNYRVDYYYQKKSGSSSKVRRQISGSSSGHLGGATTESAVMSYLHKKHPGCEITLMKLEWK